MIQMHAYPDGRTGLAAFCDTCGDQITEHGWIIWKYDDDNTSVSDWLIVHQGRCDPGHPDGYDFSMPFSAEIIYLANSTGVDLKKAQDEAVLFSTLD